MIEKTLIVVGPGGAGKSPLDALFKTDIRIEPYRLRSRGRPRNSNDIFYAHTKLRDELHRVLEGLPDAPKGLGDKHTVEWFPRSEVLFFKVRDDWQLLILKGLESSTAKAEIYAPVLPTLLSIEAIKKTLGEVWIIVLNPAHQSVTVMRDWKELEEKTRDNCKRRGDDDESVVKRVKSIAEEAPAWKELIENYGAMEYCDWQFSEYLYKEPGLGISMVEHQKQILLQARECLLKANPDLNVFFKSEGEINQITEPFVK